MVQCFIHYNLTYKCRHVTQNACTAFYNYFQYAFFTHLTTFYHWISLPVKPPFLYWIIFIFYLILFHRRLNSKVSSYNKCNNCSCHLLLLQENCNNNHAPAVHSGLHLSSLHIFILKRTKNKDYASLIRPSYLPLGLMLGWASKCISKASNRPLNNS